MNAVVRGVMHLGGVELPDFLANHPGGSIGEAHFHSSQLLEGEQQQEQEQVLVRLEPPFSV